MGKSPIGSVRLIHILANRSKSARRSGSFTLSARDKHSHAFARYLSTAFMAHPDGWPHRANVQQPWQLFPSALLSGAGWAARAGSGRLHFSHRVGASFWSSQWSGRKGSFFPDPTSAAMSKPHSKGSPPYTLARKSIAQQLQYRGRLSCSVPFHI